MSVRFVMVAGTLMNQRWFSRYDVFEGVEYLGEVSQFRRDADAGVTWLAQRANGVLLGTRHRFMRTRKEASEALR